MSRAGHRLRRRKNRWLLLAYAPFVLSPAILGVCLLYVFLRLGLAGGFAGVVCGQFIFAYAFDVVLFSGFWNAEVRALEDLVYTLGGSVTQAYWQALLPVSRGVLLVGFFQSFLLSWFDYGLTLILGSGRVQTLTVRVFEYLGAGNFPLAAVSACLLVFPPLALLAFNRRIVFAKVMSTRFHCDDAARRRRPFLSVPRTGKSFAAERVLDGSTSRSSRCETLAILGRSGCGKTTLLKILAGLCAPDAGSVQLGGRTLDGLPPQARGVVYLYQEPLLFPHLDVFENVAFGLRLRRIPPAALRERVEEMLAALDLKPTPANSPPNSPAASASAPPSAAHSSLTRRCCCSTNPSATSTWKSARICNGFSRRLRGVSASPRSSSRTTSRRRC